MTQNEEELMRQTSNLRTLLETYANEWPNAVKSGRHQAWYEALKASCAVFVGNAEVDQRDR